MNNIHRYVKMRQYDRKTTIDYNSTDDELPNMNS